MRNKEPEDVEKCGDSERSQRYSKEEY